MASQMLVTPKGSATWPRLWTPDVKFNAHGEYKIGLKIKEDLAEDLTNEITRQVDAVYASELKKNPKLQGKMTKRLPFELSHKNQQSMIQKVSQFWKPLKTWEMAQYVKLRLKQYLIYWLQQSRQVYLFV